MEKKYAHLAISKELKKEFDKLKVHPRETYEQMIVRAVNGELYPDPEDIAPKGLKSAQETI